MRMAIDSKSQLNVRVSVETLRKLDEIVEFYQENTKIGKVYKGDVLSDIIDKSHEVMNKQKLNKRPHLP
jgi:hypothetical protein